jgi:hypothetical protein
MTAASLAQLLQPFQFNFRHESDLQAGIEEALASCRVAFRREVKITGRDRIDFLCGRVGLEVKVDSSAPAVLRQLHRYAQCADLDEILLVTSRLKHRHIIPDTLNSKPIIVHNLLRL